MHRFLFFLIIGLGGTAILLSLGVWQVQRMVWKNALIADIDAKIIAEPAALPIGSYRDENAYLPVRFSGRFQGDPLLVLISQKQIGASYRVISPFKADDGHIQSDIMVDRGFVAVAEMANVDTPEGNITVTGNLQWPHETDSFTPTPDAKTGIWFARDVPAMADALGTRPILVVAREVSPSGGDVIPLPVDTSAIPNDHLQYAITWFSLAAIWLALTLTFVRRRRTPNLKAEA